MPKILLVEDDPDVAIILTDLLQSRGYEVDYAGDGKQALEKLEKNHPDLVVSDAMLPKMDGWELCKKVKENSELRKIPLLIMTGKSHSVAELRSFECGADEFIAKPFENKDILNMIHRLTQK